MNKNVYENFTDQRLLKTRSLLKGIAIGFGIIFILALVVAIYIIALKGLKDSIAALIPVFSLPIVFTPLLINFSLLSKEIKLRNL
ncbi:hypothetical protein [Flavobacterium panacagri]|uniref:hypothetical protein n=1 Tax=Flavobacterium panacagri TaxID=3034146 RepID=UPI0025A4ECDC|nr:hypothetical protein [Flavobacterium panacagri]